MTLWIRRTAWIAAIVLVACNDLEDIYCDHSGRNACDGGIDADAGPPPPPPFPDVGPFLHQDDCVECLQTTCAKKFDACMGDPVCWEAYECHGDATNPAQHGDCDPPDPNPWWDLANCAANLGCEDACALGRDFACVGQWEPKLTFETGAPIALATRAFLYLSGQAPSDLEVAACTDPSCLEPTGAVRTNDGLATLHVTSNHKYGFEGPLSFEVQGQENLPELEQIPTSFHWSGAPRDGSGVSTVALYTHELGAVYWDAVEIDFDPSRPNIQLITEDCARQPAAGLRVETDADCSPLERCAYYWSATALDPILTETQRHVPASVVITPVGGTAPDLRIVHVATGRMVARFAHIAPAGSHVHAWASPLTTTEQAQLDAAKAAAAR